MERQIPMPEGSRLIKNSPLPERDLLAKSNLEQKTLLDRRNEVPLGDVWGLFSWHERRDPFREIKGDIDGDEPGFAGKVFEDIAFIHAALKFSDQTVLSPPETKEAFGTLYPNAETIEFPFSKSLSGVHVPDGLIIDSKSGAIINSLEYTVAGLSERFFDKINPFFLRKKHFEQFAKAKLTIVVPNGSGREFDSVKNRDSVEVIELPFDRTVFGRFISKLVSSPSRPILKAS